jgi:hypothetical protein
LSSNQTTYISPPVFEGLSTFSLPSEFHVVMCATISGNKRCSPRPYLQMFVERRMFYLCYWCSLRKVASNTFCAVFGFVLLFCLFSFYVPKLYCPFCILSRLFDFFFH